MALAQNQEGNWKLTVGHRTPGVTIQNATLTFVHDGVEETMEPFNITAEDKVLDTGWYTELGTTIDVDNEIIKSPEEGSRFTYEGKKYSVHWDLAAHPYNDSGLTPQLDISASQTVVEAAKSVVTIMIVSNTAWTLSTNAAWATLDKTSGTGNDNTVKLTINRYTGTTSARTVTITAHGGGLTKPITITQNPAEEEPYLNIVASQDTISSTGGTVGIQVVSNTSWVLSRSKSWATLSQTSGTGNKDDVVLTIGQNDSTTDDRDVTITASGGGITTSVTITQSKKIVVTTLSISANPTNIMWDGSSQLSAEYIVQTDDEDAQVIPLSPSVVEWTITQNSAYTEGITSEGVLVGKNDSETQNKDVKIVGTYNNITSNVVTVKVNKKPAQRPTYKLKIVPTSTTITSAGTIQLQAQYLTYPAGSDVPSGFEDVTEYSDCTWYSDNTIVAPVTKGFVKAKNESYQTQRVVITAVYLGLRSSCYLTIEPRPGEEPVYYYVLDVLPDETTIEYSASTRMTAMLYTYESGNPQVVAERDVTRDCTWSSSSVYVFVSNSGASKGEIRGFNHGDTDQVAEITAIYEQYPNTYTDTSNVTVLGRNINIDVNLNPITFECSDVRSITRQIQTDNDVTWHLALVDVEQLGAPIDWCTVSPENGTGSGQFTVTINEDNPRNVEKECFLWIYYPADSDVRKEITVRQRPTPTFIVPVQDITVPQLGSTEKVNIATNYPISYSANGNSWITLSHETTDTNVKLNVVTTETTAQRSGTITVESKYSGECETFQPVTITVNQEYTPPPQPTANSVMYLYRTTGSSSTGDLVYDELLAAEQDIEFYVTSNGRFHVKSCSSGVTIKQTNGADITDGTFIGPTGLDNKLKLIAHIPKNSVAGGSGRRTFNVRFETEDYRGIDFNYHDHATIEFNQNGVYSRLTNVGIMYLFDNMQPGQDEITIPPAGRYVTPNLVITADRVYTDGTVQQGDRIEDYIQNPGGVIDGKLTLTTSGGGVTITNDVAHGGPYVATERQPFEIYFDSNETTAETGTVRTTYLTITYYGSNPPASKTIAVHHEWRHKDPPTVNMWLLSGDTSLEVQTVNVTLTGAGQYINASTDPSARYITISGPDIKGCEVWIAGPPDDFTVEGGMSYGQNIIPSDYPASGFDISIRNNRTSGDYTIQLVCSKPGMISKILSIKVRVSPS